LLPQSQKKKKGVLSWVRKKKQHVKKKGRRGNRTDGSDGQEEEKKRKTDLTIPGGWGGRGRKKEG